MFVPSWKINLIQVFKDFCNFKLSWSVMVILRENSTTITVEGECQGYNQMASQINRNQTCL